MRILIVSDIHSNFSMLEKVLLRESADVLAVCGDVTDFSRDDVKRFLSTIEKFSGVCLVVHGNCDYEDAFSPIDSERIRYIHGESVEVEGIMFHGLGGSTRTPFSTPSEYEERYYRRLIEGFEYGEVNILISHSPPFGILDRTHSGVNAGSKAVREELERFDAVFCGHIHEARGVEFVGNTTVVNPGALAMGEYGMSNLGREVRLMRL